MNRYQHKKQNKIAISKLEPSFTKTLKRIKSKENRENEKKITGVFLTCKSYFCERVNKKDLLKCTVVCVYAKLLIVFDLCATYGPWPARLLQPGFSRQEYLWAAMPSSRESS